VNAVKLVKKIRQYLKRCPSKQAVDVNRKAIAQKIEQYVHGALSREKVVEWAISVIVHCPWDELPEDVKEGVHLLFDLHDGQSPWEPSNQELMACKERILSKVASEEE